MQMTQTACPWIGAIPFQFREYIEQPAIPEPRKIRHRQLFVDERMIFG